jgi:hypothetical protein
MIDRVGVIQQFLGEHNVDPRYDIPDSALSYAADVDLTNSGAIDRRRGYTKVTTANVQSAFSTKAQVGYVVADGMLFQVNPDTSMDMIGASTATEFCDEGKYVFTNDGLRILGRTAIDLKIPVGETPASLSYTAGTWEPGLYSVTYCYRSIEGLEGGSAPVATIELPSDSMLVVDPITAPVGYEVVLYYTAVDGSVFYDNNGVQLNPVQVLAASFPDGADKVAFYESQLFVSIPMSTGNTVVRFSNAFQHHLFDYVQDYFIVPGEVRAMLATNGALIIGTDSAIYAYTSDGLLPLAEYGVVRGRAFSRGPNDEVYMHTTRGVGRALPFENLTEKKALFPIGEQCSTAIVQQNGSTRFVALSDGSGAAYNIRTTF